MSQSRISFSFFFFWSGKWVGLRGEGFKLGAIYQDLNILPLCLKPQLCLTVYFRLGKHNQKWEPKIGGGGIWPWLGHWGGLGPKKIMC